MGKLSRNKGAAYERYIVRRLRAMELLSSDWARVLTETQQGNIGDITDREGTWPVVIQAKHRKQLNLPGALQEAEEAAKRFPGDLVPIAWCKQHGGGEYVVMRPDTFELFLNMWDELTWTYHSTPTTILGNIKAAIMQEQEDDE